MITREDILNAIAETEELTESDRTFITVTPRKLLEILKDYQRYFEFFEGFQKPALMGLDSDDFEEHA